MTRVIGARFTCESCGNRIEVSDWAGPGLATKACPACLELIREEYFSGGWEGCVLDPTVIGARWLPEDARLSAVRSARGRCHGCGQTFWTLLGGPTLFERDPCPACFEAVIDDVMAGYGVTGYKRTDDVDATRAWEA